MEGNRVGMGRKEGAGGLGCGEGRGEGGWNAREKR